MRLGITRLMSGATVVAALFTAGTYAADPPARRSGVDTSGFDSKVRPQDDFFRYVNGAWIAKTEIPADKPVFGAFYLLRDKSEANLRAIIEEAAKSDPPAGSESRKIGDLFKSFMDESRVDELGLKPIEPDLASVDAIKDKPGLIKKLAEFQRDMLFGLFAMFVSNDAKQSDRNIVYLTQGGLGLPDEAYYREPKHQPIREKYVAHLEKMFELAKFAEPKGAASRVMAVETKLAKKHMDRVKSRDRTLTYNKLTVKALEGMAPGVDWTGWFKEVGAGSVDEVIVRTPDFFKGMSTLLDEIPISDWKEWLKWRVLASAAPTLSKPFADEDFNFSGKVLTGALEQRPRWKRGVDVVERSLGEALGKQFVEHHFPPAAKERMLALVGNLTAAYREDISTLEWMSPDTRKKALEKLTKFTTKIGYPNKWRDYSKLEIRSDDLVGNMRRAGEFEFARWLAKLGKPVDRLEWGMTPQTVNAYYNSTNNEIVFPAAILQPPFFDMERDDAANYGAIGAVIGHEIGHGFDDQGSKSDGDGNLTNWWTAEDRKEFEVRAKKLIDQYSEFEPAQLKGQKVNGALTIGENIGDLGGLTIAYKAYKRSLGGQEAPVIDGLTGDQRFFMGWAQAWRSKARDAFLARQIATDPHSPAEFRCNGVLRNMPEFYSAFGVKDGDKLWLSPEQRVRIW